MRWRRQHLIDYKIISLISAFYPFPTLVTEDGERNVMKPKPRLRWNKQFLLSIIYLCMVDIFEKCQVITYSCHCIYDRPNKCKICKRLAKVSYLIYLNEKQKSPREDFYTLSTSIKCRMFVLFQSFTKWADFPQIIHDLYKN